MTPVLFVCAALALVGWWALLRRTPAGLGGRVVVPEWRAGEYFLAGLLGCYFLLMVMAGGRPSEPIKPEAIRFGAVAYLFMLGTLLAVLVAQGHSPVKIFGLRPPRPWHVIGMALVGFAATYPVVQAAGQVAAWLGHSVSDGDEMVQFLRGPVTSADRAWIVFLAVVAAPLVEEFIFRGFLYGVLKRHFGSLAAMSASALLFAAIHQNIPAIPMLALLAIGFTLAYELTGSLWTPVVMHVIFNSISVVAIFFFPEWANNV